MPKLHIIVFLAAIALAGALAAAPSRAADDLTEISTLLQQGNAAKALERIESYLAANPRDTRGRFLKGVILTELGKTTEAIRMFSILTKDFPDLPEPYNNLAVLYAMEGDYDRARAALDTAIRKNPGYAIAYENLGDLHAKLAGQAYDKARQFDKANSNAQSKSDAVRAMLKGTAIASRPAESVPAAKAGAPKAPAPQVVAKAEPPAAASPPAKSADAAKPVIAQQPAVAAAPAPVKPAAAPAAPKPAPADPSAEVIAALNGWARAWSSKDAAAYLALYAPDFKVPGKDTRAKWEAVRRARIGKPKKIEVGISEPKVTINSPDRATVVFRQHYVSDAIDESGAKAIVFARRNGAWLILDEREVK